MPLLTLFPFHAAAAGLGDSGNALLLILAAVSLFYIAGIFISLRSYRNIQQRRSNAAWIYMGILTLASIVLTIRNMGMTSSLFSLVAIAWLYLLGKELRYTNGILLNGIFASLAYHLATDVINTLGSSMMPLLYEWSMLITGLLLAIILFFYFRRSIKPLALTGDMTLLGKGFLILVIVSLFQILMNLFIYQGRFSFDVLSYETLRGFLGFSLPVLFVSYAAYLIAGTKGKGSNRE
ncbi:MAG: hypothetical protein EOP49_20305 [Sphingobacteriales bacterium]|nr:MAG: hypothetical protein EOP49_20305 [Sphingobacteriales bacterium]